MRRNGHEFAKDKPCGSGHFGRRDQGFLEGVRERGIELHDLMIVRGGKVCYEASGIRMGRTGCTCSIR